MLLGKGFESGGHMAAMGKLLASGNNMELSAAEEIARERVAMMAVQKEMSEADEANLLEEEDMHVFDQEPLSDRFSLVSCNTCKKPIKVSQYAAHAERCRSLMMCDDSHEVDGGNGHKKLLRKARNGLLGEADVSLSDEAAAADSGVSATDVQMLGGFSNSKVGKRTMNGAEVNTGPKVGRPRKIAVSNHKEGTSMTDGIVEDFMGAGPSTVVQSEGVSSAAKRRKPFLPFTAEDLDVMCGVPSPRSGAPCRQPLTCKSHSISSKRAVVGRRKPFDALLQELKDNLARKAQQAEIPRPIATKVYCSRHHQQMRAVINNLYLGRSGSNESGASAPQQPGAGVVPVDPDLQQQQQQQQKSQHMLMSLNKGLQ